MYTYSNPKLRPTLVTYLYISHFNKNYNMNTS